jgi:hypothetical protein
MNLSLLQVLENLVVVDVSERRRTSQHEFLNRVSHVRILSAPPEFNWIGAIWYRKPVQRKRQKNTPTKLAE